MLAVRTRDGTKPAGKKMTWTTFAPGIPQPARDIVGVLPTVQLQKPGRRSERRCAVRVVRWENCGKVTSGGILSKRSGSIRSPKPQFFLYKQFAPLIILTFKFETLRARFPGL